MREAFAHADSRRVRLLALLGIVAALVLVRAETSQAAFAVSTNDAFDVAALRGAGSAACAGSGPCFFLSIELRGNGTVTSTTDPAGTRISCPPKCSTAPDWFYLGDRPREPQPVHRADPERRRVVASWR